MTRTNGGTRACFFARQSICTFLAMIAVIAGLASIAAAQVIHVDPVGGDDANDGLSWGNAKRTIQAGVDASDGGGLVYLKAGVYQPDGLVGADLSDFTGPSGATPRIYGGFTGTETSREERTFPFPLTLIDMQGREGSIGISSLGHPALPQGQPEVHNIAVANADIGFEAVGLVVGGTAYNCEVGFHESDILDWPNVIGGNTGILDARTVRSGSIVAQRDVGIDITRSPGSSTPGVPAMTVLNLERSLLGFFSSDAASALRTHPGIVNAQNSILLFESAPLLESYNCEAASFNGFAESYFRQGESPAAVCEGDVIAEGIEEIGGNPDNEIPPGSFNFDLEEPYTVTALDTSPDAGMVVTLSREIDVSPFLIGLLFNASANSRFHLVLEQLAPDQLHIMSASGIEPGDQLHLFDPRPTLDAPFVHAGLADAGFAQPDVDRPQIIAVHDEVPFALDIEFDVPINFAMFETQYNVLNVRRTGAGGFGTPLTTQKSDTEVRLEWKRSSSFRPNELEVDYNVVSSEGMRGLGTFNTEEEKGLMPEFEILSASVHRDDPLTLIIYPSRHLPGGATYRVEGPGVTGSNLASSQLLPFETAARVWPSARIQSEEPFELVVEHGDFPGGELRFNPRETAVSYVDGTGGSDLNDGTSWENARKTIYAGLYLNEWATELWVTADRFQFTPNRPSATISRFQTVIGGFAGGEETKEERPDSGFTIIENTTGKTVTVDRDAPWQVQRRVERLVAIGGDVGFGQETIPVDCLALGNPSGFRSVWAFNSQAYNNGVGFRDVAVAHNNIAAFSTIIPMGSGGQVSRRQSHNVLGPTVGTDGETDFAAWMELGDLPIVTPPANETSYTFANNAYFDKSADLHSSVISSADQYNNRPAGGELIAFSSQARTGTWTAVEIDEADRSTRLVTASGTFEPNELRGTVLLHNQSLATVSLVLENDANSVTVHGILDDAEAGQTYRLLDFRPIDGSRLINTGRNLNDNFIDRVGVQRELLSPRDIGAYETDCIGPVLATITPIGATEVVASFTLPVDPDQMGNPENYRVIQTDGPLFSITPTAASILNSTTVSVSWVAPPEMSSDATVTLEAYGMSSPGEEGCLGAPMTSLSTDAAGEPPVVDGIEITGPLSIDVLFSKAMSPDASDEIHYDLSGPGRGTLSSRPFAAVLIAPDKVRLLWMSGSMAVGNEATITVASNLTDSVGNRMGMPRIASTTVGSEAIRFPSVSLLHNTDLQQQWLTKRVGDEYSEPEQIATLPITHNALTNEAILTGRFFGGTLNDLAHVRADGTLRLVRNLGNEQFASPVAAGTGLTFAPLEGYELHVADVTGDGFPDIVQVDPVGDVSLLASPGDSVSAGASPVAIGSFSRGDYDWFGFGDVNGDGLADLILLDNNDGGRVDVVFADAEGLFADPVVWGGTGFRHSPEIDEWAVLVGDFTGDLRADLACVTEFGDVWIARAAMDGYQQPTRWGWLGYHDVPDRGWSVYAGDWSRNGIADLLQLTEFGDIWVSPSSGEGFGLPVRRVWSGFQNHPHGPLRTFSGSFAE